MSIRPLESGDLEAVLALQALCPAAAQWSRKGYMETFEHGAQGFIAEETGSPAGFVFVRVASDEMEILNLAVVPSARRRGVGRELMAHATARAMSSGLSQIFLEVRESNDAAIRFYEACGFYRSGIRLNYYTSPVESALLFVRSAVTAP
ncbi:MAG: ribosomal protein S18-alanine N-acetyltransferase [Candidatus Acidiferrales bacterium]